MKQGGQHMICDLLGAWSWRSGDTGWNGWMRDRYITTSH